MSYLTWHTRLCRVSYLQVCLETLQFTQLDEMVLKANLQYQLKSSHYPNAVLCSSAPEKKSGRKQQYATQTNLTEVNERIRPFF